MRIISGYLGGRQFSSPPGNRTHPMSEKIRGALFSMLGDISGLTVLDAFSGTGALGLEAISRGAKHATLIEKDNSAHSNILKNIRILGISSESIRVVRANCSGWSDNNPAVLFDVVLCDPPFDQVNVALLQKISLHTKTNGVVAFALPPAIEFYLPIINFQLLTTKQYGDSQLVFYRRIS